VKDYQINAKDTIFLSLINTENKLNECAKSWIKLNFMISNNILKILVFRFGKIAEVKRSVGNLINLTISEINLYYAGRFLNVEETVSSANIQENCSVLVILSNNGGNFFRLNDMIHDQKNEKIEHDLRNSLLFLTFQEKIDQFFKKYSSKIHDKSFEKLKILDGNTLLSVLLWTTNLK